jgi:hypothetical protein
MYKIENNNKTIIIDVCMLKFVKKRQKKKIKNSNKCKSL